MTDKEHQNEHMEMMVKLESVSTIIGEIRDDVRKIDGLLMSHNNQLVDGALKLANHETRIANIEAQPPPGKTVRNWGIIIAMIVAVFEILDKFALP